MFWEFPVSVSYFYMNKILAQSLSIPWGTDDSPKAIDGFSGFKFSDVGGIVSESLNYVFAFAGIGLLLMLISGGFTFLTSAGDPKKMEGGKQRLTNAFLGFIIIFVAYWIVQIAGQIFGIKTFKSIFGG